MFTKLCSSWLNWQSKSIGIEIIHLNNLFGIFRKVSQLWIWLRKRKGSNHRQDYKSWYFGIFLCFCNSNPTYCNFDPGYNILRYPSKVILISLLPERNSMRLVVIQNDPMRLQMTKKIPKLLLTFSFNVTICSQLVSYTLIIFSDWKESILVNANIDVQCTESV